jgi:peroxiredoxin
MTKTKFIVAILLAFFIGGALIYTLIEKPHAPASTFTTITGEKISLNDLRGKVVLVNFWATSCPGCINEMPHIVETYQQYKDKGLVVIAVAMPYDPPNYVLKFAQDRQLPFPVALDVKGEAVAAFGNVSLTPTSFLIGKDGAILEHKIGELDFTKLKSTLDKNLGA